MKLSAHQPGYLPNLAFFQKMALSDVFVLMDHLQYSKHDYINRAKIKTANGASWISVPVLTKGLRGQKTMETRINQNTGWQRKHWRTLNVNYAYAPYFEKFFDYFERLFCAKEWKNLIDLNLEIFDFVKTYLDIPTKIRLSSDLNIADRGQNLILAMLQKLQCSEYVTETRYDKYLRRELFAQNGAVLNFYDMKTPNYHQLFGDFIPNLSIIDLLFNEGDKSRALILENLR